MISERLPRLQILNLIIKKFMKKHPEIWDIAIYGSFIRDKEKARDIDFAILLNKNLSLKKKEELAYSIRKEISKKIPFDIDVKAVSLKDILDKNFLARQAIIAESFLLKRKRFLSDILGFKSYYLFTYSLKNLSVSKKMLFNYALKGRRGRPGLLKENKVRVIGLASILVPIEKAEFFKDFFEKYEVRYNILKLVSYS